MCIAALGMKLMCDVADFSDLRDPRRPNNLELAPTELTFGTRRLLRHDLRNVRHHCPLSHNSEL
ncbi:MAG: hypothetical protein BGO82_10805 [Devosia sp. 67-54]|nr:MAG: hypothetical protein BGO82_10805 [Devosia sp. 67-54]